MKNTGPTLIRNARIFTGDQVIEQGRIWVENGRIKEVISGSEVNNTTADNIHVIELQGKSLAPGLIDIQINGGYQYYFSQHPDEKGLLDITAACRDFGTLHFLPTLISSPQSVILSALKSVQQFKEQYPEAGVLGMHLEGPFFNPVKRGAHSPNIVRTPTDEELEDIVKAGRDVIKIMTIAPEMFTDDQIRYLLDQGILLSAGHSNMSYEQAHYYFDMGIDLITHLYNAMSGFTHRSPGFAGAALERAAVWAPIVLDGHHVHFGAARIARQMKKDRLLLLSDSSFLGRRIQDFVWGDFDAKMIDGTYRNKEGNLAGAAISMVEALENAVTHLGVTEKEAVEMATSRPALAIRMQDQIGYIKAGYPARFCVFEAGFKNLESLVL